MPSTSDVWFQLRDAATGNPYLCTVPLRISIDSSSDIDNLTKTIENMFSSQNSTILSGVVSTQLVVYANKTAFESRSIDPTIGRPLHATRSIEGLGVTEEEALIIAVPSRTRLSKARASSFIPCPLPFFCCIEDAIERDGKLCFTETIPPTSLSDLHIRDCYRMIGSDIRKGANKAIITGTPGIGKSLFLFYLLWKLIKEGKPVLLIYGPYKVYYDEMGRVFVLNAIPCTGDTSFWNNSLWCLFDDHGKGGAYLDDFGYDQCTFVLSTPPRPELVNDFKKPPQPQIFYVPVWSETEMKAIAPLFPKSSGWRKRFRILGGIPRYVFEDTREAPTKILEEACDDCSLYECIKFLHLNSTCSRNVHFLVHISSIAPFTASTVSYASRDALHVIVRRKQDEATRRIKQLGTVSSGNPLITALSRLILEPGETGTAPKGTRNQSSVRKRFKAR